MKPFVIFGDSLAVAYSEAAELRTDGMFVGGPLMGGRRFYDRHAWIEDGRLQVSKAFKPAYERFLTAAGETSFEDCVGRIVISLGMTSGPVFNGVDRFNGSHWSVFHRGAEPGGSKFYLSDGALRRIMADAQANILSIYEHGLTRGLFAAAFAPPPPPDHLSDKYGAHLVHEIARYVDGQMDQAALAMQKTFRHSAA